MRDSDRESVDDWIILLKLRFILIKVSLESVIEGFDEKETFIDQHQSQTERLVRRLKRSEDKVSLELGDVGFDVIKNLLDKVSEEQEFSPNSPRRFQIEKIGPREWNGWNRWLEDLMRVNQFALKESCLADMDYSSDGSIQALELFGLSDRVSLGFDR